MAGFARRSVAMSASLACLVRAFFVFVTLAASHAAVAVNLVSTTLTPIPGGDNWSARALVQADGKIVVVGTARHGYRKFALTRYHPDGSLDTGFGNGGTHLQAIDGRDAEAWAAVLQADGKIVVAGHVGTGNDERMALARFNPDGSLDAAFGAKVINAGPSYSRARAVAIQADGKVVVGGSSIGPTGKAVMTLARFNADGSVDSTFAGGFFYSGEAVNSETVTAIGFQSTGKIVIAGPGDGYVAMRRVNINGTVDVTWGSGANYNIRAGNDLVVQPDDKVAIVGTMPEGAISALAILRMTAAGNIDSTFGPGNACATGPCPGVAAMSVGESASGFGLVREPDGKLAVSGSTSLPGEGGSVAIGRFTADGFPDATFGTNGRATFHFNNESGFGLARRADGRFVVAGLTLARTLMGGVDIGAHQDSLTVAFTATGTLDASFNGTGYRQLDVGSITASAEASATQFDGKLVVTGATFAEAHGFGTPRQGGFLARYLANGAFDASFAGGGYITFPWPARAIAIRPGDDRIVIGGYSLTGANVPSMTFARFLADGTADSSFGTAGRAVIAPETVDEQVNAIFLMDDGRIVGGGFRFTGTDTDSILVRLTATGALDTTFAGTGKKVVAMSEDGNEINAVLVQGDGKVVGAGMGIGPPLQRIIAVTRLNADGTPDATFGNQGVATATFGSRSARGHALFMQGASKLVVGGAVGNGADDDFALARFNANGTLDASFGTGGIVTTDFGGVDRIHAFQPFADGTFLAAGQIGAAYGVAAYEQNGLLNTTYGSGGRFTVALNGPDDHANAINFVGGGNEYILSGSASGIVGLARIFGSPVSQQHGSIVLIASSQNPSLTGQNVTFTATVSGSQGTPTGAVDFVLGGGTPIQGCTGVALAGGSATCTTSFPTTGTFTVFANYLGDATYRPSNAAREQTVNANHSTPTVSLASSANPSTFNQSVTFTTSVTGSAGTATGTVSFRDAGTPIYGCHLLALSGGSATCTTNGLVPGSHAITVNYNGDGTYQPATSATLNQSVQGTAPTPSAAWKATTTSTPPLVLASPPAHVTTPGPRSALDASGNLFAIASTEEGSATCLVVLKYASSNGAITWRRDLCSAAADTFGSALAIDAAGNLLVAGTVQGQLYVAKWSGATGATIWEQRIAPGGSGFNEGAALGIDASGNPRVLSSNSGIVTVYAFTAAGAPQWQRALDEGMGGAKIHAFAVDAAGNSVVAERHFTDIHDNVADVTTRIDASGSITWSAVHGGVVNAVAFDPSGNVLQSGVSGLRKLAAATGALLWSQPYSGAMKIDAQGNVYLTSFVSASFEQPDTNVRTVKISPAGALLWSHVLVDPAQYGGGDAIDLDPAGNPVVTGYSAPGEVRTMRYAAADGRILWMATVPASPLPHIAHSVHASSQGTYVLGQLRNAGAPAGLFAVKYADGTPSAQEAMATHYYRSILRRDPDAAGLQFWIAEAERVTALGADVSETWYAMASTFFASAEYAAFNRDDAGFVTDLYTTFFDRAPDSAGHAYWTGQIAAGMPRDVVLAGFMFSPEFRNFTRAQFGDTTARPEVNMVMDLYRAFMARLPDSAGFTYWLGRMRQAQCEGAASIYAEVEAISSGFANSPEYAARGRNNALFVADLYNGYLRRGGDLEGVRFWIEQLDSGARTRDQVRRSFMESPEFRARVAAIVAAGCVGS
jgi:uncharacterized delta-60 repeat protein